MGRLIPHGAVRQISGAASISQTIAADGGECRKLEGFATAAHGAR
jgi:hypothetical protein